MSDKTSYVTLWVCLVISLGLTSCSAPELKPTKTVYPHTLVIGLDGVSYFTFKKLQAGGHFRSFNKVSPMVASFPSISDPNWTHILNLPPEPGFTKAFFDPTIKTPTGFGQESGSLLSHVAKEPLYEQAMDFKVDGTLEHITMLIWTETMAKYLLESLEKDFLAFTGRDTYMALIINTDIVSHTKGEETLMNYLVQVERMTDRVRAEYENLHHEPLEIILVSDHGNAYFQPQDVPFEKTLAQENWTLSETISDKKSVGFFVPEILSFGAFYSQHNSARDLALSLSHADHIQSTMYQEDNGDITIFSQRPRSETRFHYAPKTGALTDWLVSGNADPFDQLKLFKSKTLNANGYFDLTLQDKYPDALVRIWEGFNTDSKTKPSVLANPELGFVFGNPTLHVITSLRGFESSHGSLDRKETLGIFVSDKRTLPAVRPQQIRNFFHVDGLKENLKLTK